MNKVKQPISPRVIDGEVYHISSWTDVRNKTTIQSAQAEARYQRAKGYKVRIVKTKNAVAVFRRK